MKRLHLWFVAAGLVMCLASCSGEEDDSGSSKAPPPPLPAEFLSIASGFVVETIVSGAAKPAKMALSPDGRLFYNELDTGQIRIVANGQLLAAPFATVNVRLDSESGLLGICFSPSFASDGYVYVMACIANPTPPHKQQIIRFTAVGNTGTNPTVIVDNLPHANVHNSGNIAFGADGKLYATVGDAGNPALSQTDGSLAGRLLRYEQSGAPATGNPIPGDPEFSRGLRNTFDFCFQPTNGAIFGSENGPNDSDEINYLAAGKNFEWQTVPITVPQSAIGFRMRVYVSVIAPTGICVHTGQNFPSGYANNIFLCSYDYAEIRRLVMSGSSLADVDSESVWASLSNIGVANKPLDILMAPDGSLYLSTFTAIYRLSRY